MESSSKTQEKETDSFLKKNIIKNWKIIAALAILLSIVLYYNFILYQTKNQFKEEKETLITQYTQEIDSLKLAKTTEIVKVFSWAVRSELLRENFEQVDLLFNTFVKESNMVKISLINIETQKVQLSTDKKLENELFTELDLLKLNELTVDNNRIVAPISGLNKQLGLLIVDFE